MNYDWTPGELELKSKLAEMFGEEPFLDLHRLRGAELGELKSRTLACLKALAELGYLSLGAGERRREDTMPLVAGQEELSALSGWLFIVVETSARLFGGLVAAYGTDRMVSEFHEPITKGDLIGAVAVAEPSNIFDDEDPRTRAILDGDSYVLTGSKNFVTNGPIADVVAVSARTDDKLVLLLVDPDQDGVDIGPRMSTLGYDGLAVSTLELNHARVPVERTMGPFEDESPLEHWRSMLDLTLTMASVGLMDRTTRCVKEYAQAHVRDGKQIFKRQEVRFKIADMLTLYQTSQLMAYRAAWLYGEQDPEASTIINCAKVFCSEAVEKVASWGMQIMAGQGYLLGNPVERAYRDAKFPSIAGTTSEMARMAIADKMLDLCRV